MGKGALVFKGDKPPKSKSKKSKKSKKPKHSGGGDGGGAESHPISSAAVAVHHGTASASSYAEGGTTAAASAAATAPQPQIQEGIGRITTSGTVLTGHGTRLLKQGIRAGDAILVSIDGTEEMRVLTMVLSEGSASLSTPFSMSLKTPNGFHYIQKPRNVAKERADKARKIKLTKEEEERSAFGTYGSGADSSSGATEFVYRETTAHGSYRIRKERLDGEVSRGDLLRMRTKKKSDKYC